MKHVSLYELIIKSSNEAIKLQKKDGSMPAGHNGTRNDPETPVRNTGHWLITFIKVYELTKEHKYYDAAYRCIDYLLSKDARPMGASFWHRKNPYKDFCNGVMGQAYTIEALATAFGLFHDQRILETAEEVFLMHPFDKNKGIWRRVSVDGSYLSFDRTFNHQLWFGAAGALLSQYSDGEVKERIELFLDKLKKNLKIYPNGLIKHRHILNYKIKQALGYHQFNLYAFSLLKSIYPEHKFWRNKKFLKALKLEQSKIYKSIIEDESFSSPYNPAGFDTSFIERAFVLKTFYDKYEDEQKRLVSLQINRSYDFTNNMLSLRSKDPVTVAARLYKATRLPDLIIEVK